MRTTHRARWAGAVASAVVLVTGCSGHPSPPNVASFGPTSTAAAGSSSPSDTSGLSHLEDYSKCMRAHGVHDFPDPTAGPNGAVGIQISAQRGSDLAPDNPVFQAADNACKSLMPGRNLTPAQVAQQIAQGVRFAACMRSHGIAGWPDPDSEGAFDINGIDLQSPQVSTAQQACRTQLHFSGPMRVKATNAGPPGQ